uniref:Uncharacterized protein n=1 Tax=Anguilla anguilla TaxID=7936 RepID=A0A0E9PQZ6_ANGAN
MMPELFGIMLNGHLSQKWNFVNDVGPIMSSVAPFHSKNTIAAVKRGGGSVMLFCCLRTWTFSYY